MCLGVTCTASDQCHTVGECDVNTGVCSNPEAVSGIVDCAGDCNGTATKDQCGICDSDLTNDCEQDCAETWGGTAEIDCAGVCNGGCLMCDNNGACTGKF